MKEMYFAGGCFWGMEKLFQCLDGVCDTDCGYANGKDGIEVSYQRVCQGDTEYRECVHVSYDEAKITLKQLLDAFFFVVDPTTKNQQGNDLGTQYQTGLYYVNEDDAKIIQAYVDTIKSKYPVFVVEVKPLECFILAEDYHQDYLQKNPTGYCHIPSAKYEEVNAYVHKDKGSAE